MIRADTVLSRRGFFGAGAMLGGGAILAACSKAPALATPNVAPRAAKLIAAAREQVGVTLHYDPAYTALDFPGGDVDRAKGVCTDVIIRAYRDGLGLDLQQLVNEDMRAAFSGYPQNWGLSRPDKNIDHRRVPNLQTFWKREGALQPEVADWQPGDIFTSLIGGRLPHTGIVSDQRAPSGNLMIVHNIGRGAREEDALFDHKITGHYRWQL